MNDRVLKQEELARIRDRLDLMIIHLENAQDAYRVDVNVNYALYLAKELRKDL